MRTTVSNIWFIAKSDVLFALRDRATLLWLILMPPVFFFFIGNMTEGGIGQIVTDSKIVIEAPSSMDSVGLRFEDLLIDGGFTIIRPGDRESDAPLLDMSSGLSDLNNPVAATFHAEKPTPTTDFEVLRLRRAAMMLQAELAVLSAQGRGPENLGDLAVEPKALKVSIESAGRLDRVPSGFEQTIPGILVMFTMLVLLTSGSILLLLEREQGMLRRLASAPMSHQEIVAGKWLGKMLLAIAQIGLAMTVGTFLFGMNWGANLPAILVLLTGWAAFNASLGLLVGSVGRTQAEVGGFGLLLTMIMAALGGAWWPIEVTPGWMQDLQKAVPAGWAMDAIHRLVSFGDTPAVVVPHLAGLLVSATVIAALAARYFQFD